MPGPPPKPRNQRARRNPETAQPVELEFVPGEPPELPTTWIDQEGRLNEIGWSPLTLAWWESWRTSPQAKIFSQSDWQSLLTTAHVADQWHKTWKVSYAAELRQRESTFGATPLDRLRLRMTWREDAEHGWKLSEADRKQREKEARRQYGDIRVLRTGTDE